MERETEGGRERKREMLIMILLLLKDTSYSPLKNKFKKNAGGE